MNTMRDQIVKSIAELVLKIRNLEVRNSDRLDFREVHVSEVKRALEEAYEAGRIAGRSEATK